MNKFMSGLTLGIAITAFVFIWFDPLQKKPVQHDHLLPPVFSDTIALATTAADSTKLVPGTDKINRDSLVQFAASLTGTPYLYGSADPLKGFDCSGYVTYVFNHFRMEVPRSSFDFRGKGIQRTLANCRKGDLLLFSGTDSLEHTIGHMGIVSSNLDGWPEFLHSTSGKAQGVTTTKMDNAFYQKRFIDAVDILSQ